jgi:hypothetical protein
MSVPAIKPIARLEDDQLWRAVSKIARHAFNSVRQLPEENFTLRNKFEYAGYDMTSDVAEAAGSLDPRDIKWSLGRARKDLFSLKNSYSLAFHTDQLPVEPETMLAIDTAVKLLDERVKGLEPSFKEWQDEMNLGKKA